MNVATSLGALFCAAGMLTGGGPAASSAGTKVVPAKVIVVADQQKQAPVATSISACDPCCEKCQRGLLRIFQRRRCQCDACCQTVCREHCEKDPCCNYRRKLSFIRLIRRILGCRDRCCCCQPCEPVVVTEAPAPKPTPKVVTKASPPRVPPAPPKPDYASDYRWVQGELHYVHVNGGAWVIRYAPLDKTDKYGGSVVLSRDSRMHRYKEGDFVRVEGEILSDRSTVFLGGPLYRIGDVLLVQSGSDTMLR